jgi:virginiamycin B lyase
VPNVALTVKVAGEGTIPATGVGRIEAIVSTLVPVATGTITVGGTGYSQPLEYPAGVTRAFGVNPTLTGGSITLTSTTAVDVVLDVSGWYSDATGPTGSVFTGLQDKFLDTRTPFRTGNCPSTQAQCVALTSTTPLQVKVAGFGSVPANATAVRLVVSSVSPTGTGEIRVSPTGAPSTTGFVDTQATGAFRSTTGVVKVGTGGTVTLTLVGTTSTEVVIDVLGYYAPDPVGPVLIGSAAAQPVLVNSQAVAASETVGVRIGGYTGIPTSGVSSVVLAVTPNTTKSSLEGYASLWAGGTSAPNGAQIYWARTETPTFVVTVPVGPDGRVNMFSSFAASFSIKVLGHFATPVGAGVTFTYDANGNRLTSVDAVSGKTSSYVWDDTSRLTSVCTATTGVACSNPEEVNVYDADGQRLVRRSRSGVTPSQSVQPAFIPTTTSQSRDVHAGTIGRANIDGTGVNQSFITGIDAPSGITSDGTYLYWTTGGLNDTYGTGGVARAGLDGVTGRNNTFITGASKPLAVSVDANYVYWSNTNGSTIGRATIGGAGANQSFIAAGSYPYGLEVRGGFIYWANFLLGSGAWGNQIGRADVGGTNINSSFITTSAGSAPTGLTSDGTYLYWTNYATSKIGRSLLNGTGVDQAYVVPPTTAVADSFNPVGIAVTATHVLWTNLDAPKIGRAAFAGTGDQLTIFLDGQEIVNNPGSAVVTSAARYYSGSGLLATRSTVGGLTYVGTDSQGTLTATLTTAGVSTRQRYKPFGEQRGATNVLPSERGFIGQVEDTAMGLSYLNARHYDAKNATFIGVDPVLSIYDPTSLNAYIYGGNNPVRFSDPSGLEKGANGETKSCPTPGTCGSTVKKLPYGPPAPKTTSPSTTTSPPTTTPGAAQGQVMTAGPPDVLVPIGGLKDASADKWTQVGKQLVPCCGTVATYSNEDSAKGVGKDYLIAIGIKPVCKTKLGCTGFLSVTEQFSLLLYDSVSITSFGPTQLFKIGNGSNDHMFEIAFSPDRDTNDVVTDIASAMGGVFSANPTRGTGKKAFVDQPGTSSDNLAGNGDRLASNATWGAFEIVVYAKKVKK